MYRMDDYEAACREHSLQVPPTFNFGRDVVDYHARDPAKLALIWSDDRGRERRMTFAEVAHESNRIANWLCSRGVTRGDRIIVMLPRVPQWQIAVVACLKLGAVPIPCITMLQPKDIEYRVAHSGAVGVITTTDETRKFAPLTGFRALLAVGGGAPGWTDYMQALECSHSFTPCDLPSEDPAILYYTSGSTGLPKGVCHASRALYVWRASARYWLTLGLDDVMWCTADTGWSKAGTSILFGPWSQGSAVLFYDGPFNARQRFALMERHRVTVFCAAATELRRLIHEDISEFDLSALRMSVSAGESVNPEVLNAWTSLVGVPLLDGYGQTETLMTVLNYDGTPIKPGAMGRPLPGVIAGVLTGTDTMGGAGSEGQLAIRMPNPQVMLGYWDDPDRTKSSFVHVDGHDWFATGDNVYQDEDGYLFFRGRVDDIINSAGYRIGPQEVENALIEHEAVQESAVVGIPDAERGEIVKAFVVLNESAQASDTLMRALQEHVKATTAPYKYPRRIEFVSDLPKTVSGKIQRGVLRDRERTRSEQRDL